MGTFLYIFLSGKVKEQKRKKVKRLKNYSTSIVM